VDLRAELNVCRKFSPIGIRSLDRPIRSQSVPTELSWSTDGKGKGKVILLQAEMGHEGSRRLRLPDFKKTGA
jgi:hypothetical protein